MRIWIKRFVAIIAIAALVLIGFWRYWIWKNQRDAERFVTSVKTLVIGKSTAADLSTLIKSIPIGTNHYFDCSPSGNGECEAIVNLSNFSRFSWPYRLHLAVAMGLRCTFYTENDKLRSLLCVMQSSKAMDTNTYVQEGEGPARCFSELNSENKFFETQGFPTGFCGVCINERTPSDLRDLAFKFDFGCFSRLHGCSTFEEMLPVLSRKDLY
ncbi:MAG TPA: hypothetical protein VGZ48_09965 [Candidatus Acidoferrales bacterium]|nr:hypothetical protein [Candidatus Acidoferrales bacterium]